MLLPKCSDRKGPAFLQGYRKCFVELRDFAPILMNHYFEPAINH